jgi:hypothetical protein
MYPSKAGANNVTDCTFAMHCHRIFRTPVAIDKKADHADRRRNDVRVRVSR